MIIEYTITLTFVFNKSWLSNQNPYMGIQIFLQFVLGPIDGVDIGWSNGLVPLLEPMMTQFTDTRYEASVSLGR